MIRKLVAIVSWCFALALLAGYLSTSVSPATFAYFGFIGLIIPYLALINLILLLVWAYKRSGYILIPALALVLSYPNINNHFNFFKSSSTEDSSLGDTLSIMSYNVRLFDAYNWSNNYTSKAGLMEILNGFNGDIVCIQEYYDQPKELTYPTYQEFAKAPFAKHKHHHFTLEQRVSWVPVTQRFGIATFSKYPIINKGHIEFGTQQHNTCIYSDIALPRDTIRVYNVHLASLKFSQEDYKFLASIMENKSQQNIDGSKRLLSRIKKGFQVRASQADLLAEHLLTSPYPVVICGDFNDTPGSYAYNTIKGELKDAFTEAGTGFGSTYAGKIPGLRIDHIMHDAAWNTIDFTVNPKVCSDHKAISATLVR